MSTGTDETFRGEMRRGSAGMDPQLTRKYSMKRLLTIAAVLIVAALVLAVLGFVLRTLRWLLIIAALVLVIGAALGFKARGDVEDGR